MSTAAHGICNDRQISQVCPATTSALVLLPEFWQLTCLTTSADSCCLATSLLDVFNSAMLPEGSTLLAQMWQPTLHGKAPKSSLHTVRWCVNAAAVKCCEVRLKVPCARSVQCPSCSMYMPSAADLVDYWCRQPQVRCLLVLQERQPKASIQTVGHQVQAAAAQVWNML